MMKILLVEDDRWFAESLANSLSSANNCQVKIVDSTDEAARTIDDFYPDVIILDIMLGAKNGLILLNELQSYVDTRQLPVIILSSNTAQLNLGDLRSFGVRKVLDKSKTTPSEVAEICKTVIARRNDEAIQTGSLRFTRDDDMGHHD